MITQKLKELHALKAKAAALEQEIAAERAKDLASLPAQFGFSDASAFAAAVLAASGGRRGRRGRPARANAKQGREGGRKPRATVTDEMRAELKKLVKAGKTGNEIAKTLGISLPTVQNIKKALGLTRKS
jgi:DNA-binding NarL/FixJ family response regulator